MHNKEQLQENQYVFPYHYLTGIKDDVFKLHEYLPWGLVHYSYIEFVAKKVAELGKRNILDAGCGDGRMIYELRKHSTESSYTGVDISEQALRFARAFNPDATFQVHDILSEPVQGNFDLCVSIEVIEHIPPKQVDLYVKHIARSLNERGELVLTTPTTNIPVTAKHYQHFTLESLRKHLDKHFDVVEVQYLNIENTLANTLTRMLANKFFVINNTFIRRHLFNCYKRHCLHGDGQSGSRIYIYAKKR